METGRLVLFISSMILGKLTHLSKPQPAHDDGAPSVTLLGLLVVTAATLSAGGRKDSSLTSVTR